MSSRLLNYLSAGVGVVVLIVVLLVLVLQSPHEPDTRQQAKARARDQGRRAALFMAPCYGNPYQGTESHIDESVEWCEGWIEGRKELEQRAND
jgi:hypothetical protein